VTNAVITAAIGLSKPLRVWEKIELQIGDGPEAGHYLARIQDFINGGIVITDPEFLSGGSLLRENTAVIVMVRREDAMYQFVSTIKRVLGKGGRQFILSPPRRFERVQRRMFVRVDLHSKLSYARIVPLGDWQSYDDRLAWHQSRTYDLSGGGNLFHSVDEVPVGELVLLRMEYLKELQLPETIVAQAHRCALVKGEWQCGVQFVLSDTLSAHLEPREIAALPASIRRFDRNAQNRLSTAVFALQVELRKKGLL
jgi:c-di-GMP-binding flagellar brake protein YcgR